MLILLHYAKRELETLLCVFLFSTVSCSDPVSLTSGVVPSLISVHRFSSATMPFFNIFKKCGVCFLSLPVCLQTCS